LQDTEHGGDDVDERDPQRRVAQYRLERLEAQDQLDGPPGPGSDGTRGVLADGGAEPTPGARGRAGVDATTGGPEPAGAAPRPPTMAARGAFADELVRQAMARGEFDDLPLTGKPIPGLSGRYDPDWWLKSFIEREQITGVLPEALQLRKDDAVLDARLDDEHLESRVRETLEEFNARVVAARRQLLGGPPVVTPTRDVEREVTRWRERRRAREAAADAERAATDVGRSRSGRWWGGRRRG
jgi:hypothetical protein